jgi:hypothetical protein
LKLASASSSDRVLRNLSLEAFLLHARNLRDFFVGTGDKRDILVIDYLPKKPRFRLPTLYRTWNRLDKLLAHPSYQRPRLKKYWPVVAMHKELLAAWDLFLKRLATGDPKARQDFRKLGH